MSPMFAIIIAPTVTALPKTWDRSKSLQVRLDQQVTTDSRAWAVVSEIAGQEAMSCDAVMHKCSVMHSNHEVDSKCEICKTMLCKQRSISL